LPKFISRDTIRRAEAIVEPAPEDVGPSMRATDSPCSANPPARRAAMTGAGQKLFIAACGVVASFALTAPAKAECSRTLLSFGPGIESYAAQMQVEKGGGCNIEVGGRWSKRQLVDNLEGVSVVKRPSHGQAGGRSANQLAYKPDPNYVGRDEFSVLVKFVAHGVAGATRLDITVDVVDHL
jgi:hypothetical protein